MSVKTPGRDRGTLHAIEHREPIEQRNSARQLPMADLVFDAFATRS